MNYAAIDENGIYGGMVTAVEATAPDVGFYAPEGIRISRFDAPPTDEPGKWIETASGWRELDAAEALTIMRESFTVRIQQHLDNFAKTRNYDNTFTAATYATSSNSRFASEGRYIVEARDAVWAKAYEIMDDVLSGRRTLPSFEEILAELPKLEWPGSAPSPLTAQAGLSSPASLGSDDNGGAQ